MLRRLSSLKGIDCIFDVGANVGDWSLLAAKFFPGSNIWSFEMSFETHEHLNSNVSDISAIHPVNMALSNSSGRTQYLDHGDDAGTNSLVSSCQDDVDAILKEVESVTGTQFCSGNGIDRIGLLKIDVEGAERLVLEGFDEMLDAGKIDVIQFEYGYANGDDHFLMRDFYELLTRKGYIMGPLKPAGVFFADFEYPLNNFDSGPNYVAVRKELYHVISLIQADRPLRSFPLF